MKNPPPGGFRYSLYSDNIIFPIERAIPGGRTVWAVGSKGAGRSRSQSWPQSGRGRARRGRRPFPTKTVRYVVPFGAGGSPDIVARLLTERLTRLWGQQVIVDNRVGVAGVLGTAFVAKSPPDGHTLVQCNVASSGIGVSLFAKMPYDQLRDIAAVTRIGMTPNIIFVHPSMPVKTMKQLVAYARANPGKLSYASGLVGTSPQLSMELLKLMAKIDIVSIPYKIGAQGITDNIAGQVPVGISNFPASVAPVQSGRLRPLAVTTAPTRSRSFPTCRRCRNRDFPASK